jgi:CheY-like chemotaxis protein
LVVATDLDAPATVIGRPIEILLVEDSLIDARISMAAMRKGLSQHRLTLVCDGEEALQFLRRQGIFARAPRPDIILLDLVLPKLDGFAVLESVKSDPGLQDIPVVVMTSSDAEEDRQRCASFHVEQYITKPVNLEAFLEVLRRVRKHLQDDVILPTVP